MTADEVARIDVYSRWLGFSAPVEAARVTVRRAGDGFVREVALGGPPEPLPAAAMGELVAALSAPQVPVLDPARFDAPAEAVERHFGSLWTNDSPDLLVRLTTADGTVTDARSESQHVHMLPFRVGSPPADTFDPRLSQAVAGLLPENHHLLDKLLDRSGVLAAEAAEMEQEPDRPVEVPPDPPPGPIDFDEFEQKMHDLFMGNESPEQRDESERTGNLSERLLRNLADREVRDLLARGAKPSVADDVGQTALMHAAFPPLNAERFRILAAAGADVEARRDDGLTGLHIAAAGDGPLVAEWLRAGADPNARVPDEDATPLMLGARWPEVVRALLAAGADPNAADKDGHTPLAYIAIQQNTFDTSREQECIGLLVAAGADVNRRDNAGRAPRAHARRVVAERELDAEVCRALWGTERTNMDEATSAARAVADRLAAAGGVE